MTGIYIHIPFCQSRCIYCDFYSTLHLDKREHYVAKLLDEMRSRKAELEPRARTYHTLYIGGGTPSTLPPSLLCHLLQQSVELFPLQPGAEVTVEANPDDVTPEWVAMLKDTPVNRISMGTQTFDDTLLNFLHRRHSSQQSIRAVHLLQDAGYTNISLDLIYGIPGQDRDVWQRDVAQAISLDIPHLSAYSLMYEEGTALTQLRDRGKIEEMDEETSLWCYEHLCEATEKAGYEHYEISNFAHPGFHSRHNSSYWQGLPYLGFGAGAHSYDGERQRSWNDGNLLSYIAEGPTRQTEQLTDTDLYNEYVMTRLRTSKGLDLNMLEQLFGPAMLRYCLEQAKPHLQAGHLQQTGHVLSLSRGGIFVSNQVMSDLFFT